MKSITLLAVLFISLGVFAAKSEAINHRIQPKETLFRISLMYNSTVEDIVKANPGLNPKHIETGSTIRVPKDTKIRDAEFVAQFLNPKGEAAPVAHTSEPAKPVAQVVPVIKSNVEPARTSPQSLSISQLAQVSPSENITESKPYVPAAKPAGEKPVIKEAAITPSAEPAKAISAASDENPFLTPSEPRTGPAADEVPVIETKTSLPASADNGAAEDDENPFMSPKQKQEAPKAHK